MATDNPNYVRDYDIHYVLVEVVGVESQEAAYRAVDNLTNAEQEFNSIDVKTVSSVKVDQAGQPVIYFP
jgi:hypothetical protein